MIDKCILLGDFNLNYDKIYDDNYAHRALFDDFEKVLSHENLIQIVNFATWSRMYGQTLKSSTLDHIYVKDPTLVYNLKSLEPLFGDHLLIVFGVDGVKVRPRVSKRRDWRLYSKESPIRELRVGLNALSNRFHCLNDLIPLSWLNMSMNTFKVNCKKLLLNN